MITPRRTLATSFAILALVLAWSGRLLAVGPSVLMFYGDPLKKPVLVSGSDAAAFDNMLGSASVSESDLAGRTPISVALFWGPATNPANNGVPIDQLKPEMAMQHGRYYPPTATKPAVILVTQFTKMVQPSAPSSSAAYNFGGPLSSNAVAVLKRLGVPTGPPR